jgi:hypothetical protein
VRRGAGHIGRRGRRRGAGCIPGTDAVVAQRQRLFEVSRQWRESGEVLLPLRRVELAKTHALGPALIAKAERCSGKTREPRRRRTRNRGRGSRVRVGSAWNQPGGGSAPSAAHALAREQPHLRHHADTAYTVGTVLRSFRAE